MGEVKGRVPSGTAHFNGSLSIKWSMSAMKPVPLELQQMKRGPGSWQPKELEVCALFQASEYRLQPLDSKVMLSHFI